MSAVQYKLMPSSLEADLPSIKDSAQKTIEELGGIPNSIEEQPIAFGLKALIVSFAFPEENEVDDIGNAFMKIPEVSSAEMIDYRRALG